MLMVMRGHEREDVTGRCGEVSNVRLELVREVIPPGKEVATPEGDANVVDFEAHDGP
jgi:hypothetical protein